MPPDVWVGNTHGVGGEKSGNGKQDGEYQGLRKPLLPFQSRSDLRRVAMWLCCLRIPQLSVDFVRQIENRHDPECTSVRARIP
jgi:hypothetical protein